MPRHRRHAAAKSRGSVRAKAGRRSTLNTSLRTALATAVMLAMLVLGWPAAAMATPTPSPTATATPSATATADDNGAARTVKEPTDDSTTRELSTQAPELSGISPSPTPQTPPTAPDTTPPAETTTATPTPDPTPAGATPPPTDPTTPPTTSTPEEVVPTTPPPTTTPPVVSPPPTSVEPPATVDPPATGGTTTPPATDGGNIDLPVPPPVDEMDPGTPTETEAPPTDNGEGSQDTPDNTNGEATPETPGTPDAAGEPVAVTPNITVVEGKPTPKEDANGNSIEKPEPRDDDDDNDGIKNADVLVYVNWQVNGRPATHGEVASLGVSAHLMLAPGSANGAQFGVPAIGYEDGGSVTIKEGFSSGQQCRLLSRSLAGKALPDSGATVPLSAGINSFTITNSLDCSNQEGDLQLLKTAGVPVPGEAGSWSIGYDITVTNTSRSSDNTYSLSDTLGFGPGVTIKSATWTRTGGAPASGSWASPDANRTTILAPAGTVIGHSPDGNTVHTYSVRAVVGVPAGTRAAHLDCRIDSGSGTGLTSSVQLNGLSAKACQPLPVTLKATNSWNINGTVYAGGSQPDGFAAELVLPDGGGEPAPGRWGTVYAYDAGTRLALGANLTLPAGCAVADSDGLGRVTKLMIANEVAVTNTIDCQQQLTLIKAVGPQPPLGISPDDWKLSATPAGGEAAAVAGATGIAGSVAAGTAYDLSETAGFIGGTEFLASDWSCELDSGSGTLHQDGTIVVPSYGQSIVCSIVSSWEAPALNVTKSVREPAKVNGADEGVWDVVYEVSVENPSVVAGATYNLTDTLDFGEGVDIQNARWMLLGTSDGGEWADPEADPAAVLATERSLELLDSHLYLVNVRIKLDPNVPAEQLDCVADAASGTGLRNTVQLGEEGRGSICIPAPGGESAIAAAPEGDQPEVSARDAERAETRLLPVPPLGGQAEGPEAGETPEDQQAASPGESETEEQPAAADGMLRPRLLQLDPAFALSQTATVSAIAAAMLLIGAYGAVLFAARKRP
ncbi:hypothetical protein [Arthrobacter sp. VKM Ac-2550]|uniref:hypothetical protein n=1 Tax=Crystallibacter permensis TaxID=1938888 RepID=UPI0022260C41|nr:hypothetical protein [Arthrobacter sp. VKM Ac-2550]MCW2135380.1 hypothetical protein [Arthrobacter sp. VKM Ac-2550]